MKVENIEKVQEVFSAVNAYVTLPIVYGDTLDVRSDCFLLHKGEKEYVSPNVQSLLRRLGIKKAVASKLDATLLNDVVNALASSEGGDGEEQPFSFLANGFELVAPLPKKWQWYDAYELFYRAAEDVDSSAVFTVETATVSSEDGFCVRMKAAEPPVEVSENAFADYIVDIHMPFIEKPKRFSVDAHVRLSDGVSEGEYATIFHKEFKPSKRKKGQTTEEWMSVAISEAIDFEAYEIASLKEAAKEVIDSSHNEIVTNACRKCRVSGEQRENLVDCFVSAHTMLLGVMAAVSLTGQDDIQEKKAIGKALHHGCVCGRCRHEEIDYSEEDDA